jgi:hypothetical protein
MERMRSLIAAPVAVAALLTAGTAVTAVAAPATAALPCHAVMSNYHPRDYTTTHVQVHTVASAAVTTVAHYRTTNHKKTGTAGSNGNASIGYYISGATPGYRVVVSVRVVSGNRSGSCSTWFTPNR